MTEPGKAEEAEIPLRIGVFGTPVSSGNRGVLALAEALIRLCRRASPGARVHLFGSDRKGEPVTLWPDGEPLEIPLVCWRLSPRGGLRENLVWIVAMSLAYRCLPFAAIRRRISRATPWIAALEQMDLVGDIRGGDSFSDIYGLKRFIIATLPVLSVILVKGSIVQFPQTYGPYKSTLSRVIARYVLRHSSEVVARDTRSQAVACEIAGAGVDVGLSPDVAFALHVRAPALPVEMDPATDAGFPLGAVGLNVNGLMYHGGYHGGNMFGLRMDYRDFLVRLATGILGEHEGDLVLVPHTIAPAGDAESDNGACAELRESLPEVLRPRVRIITGDYDPHEIKHVIGCCDFFVGSRMHSCIAALSQGIPCVGVAYSMKFAGVFESVGMGDWVVDARERTADEAVAAILRLHAGREGVRAPLAERVRSAQSDLDRLFGKLVGSARRQEPVAGAAERVGGDLSTAGR